ncbi:hypothetical protein [Paractinoplanes toevensis]|uniref:Uncharacterized protein n=1 Tax=Paractinoplanes toevensis TaxID=571911 RepID=A0A919T6Z4_9ACTN|nr:hypothetical protein [Actinoplanes toevensis]GIM88721.1 hypothetical protein Ato02nite_005140 [Actinoplanes toevensis]
MKFQPQPYPLFYACISGGKVEVGRVIGWQRPGNDDDDSVDLKPVVLMERDDRTSAQPTYLDLAHEHCWIGDDRSAVTDRAMATLMAKEG